MYIFVVNVEIDLEQPASQISQSTFSILKSECEAGRFLTAVEGASSGGTDKEIAIIF